MSKVLITGVAGFIGSHLAERLVAEGYHVVGVDCFTDYYSREIKEANLTNLRQSSNFEFVEGDILELNWTPLLDNVAYLLHHAAQAGVRASWGRLFESYTRNNILATQTLLEAAKNARLKKFIYASSSSVYGDAEAFPTSEDSMPLPVSPYGVTKLAAEHLCRLYHRSFGVPTVSLRYFTVYGPRQRPDMAFHKFIRAALTGCAVEVYGDGNQTRDFTFISDAIAANLAAMHAPVEGQVLNIGGGSRISINQVLAVLKRMLGTKISVVYREAQRGDARHTAADISRANALLGYKPQVDLEKGLTYEVQWLKEMAEEMSDVLGI